MRRLPLDFRDQYFGCEIELTGINRATAAHALADLFGTRAEHSGGGYDAYRVKDLDGKEWKIVRDASIHPEGYVRSSTSGEYKVELNSPKLEYAEMEKLQEVVRALRRAGGKVNSSCGMHVHVDASKHTPQSLKNVLSIMYSKEDILFAALKVNPVRISSYCQPVDEPILEEIRKLPSGASMDQLKDRWYQGRDGSDYHYHQSRYHAFYGGSFLVQWNAKGMRSAWGASIPFCVHPEKSALFDSKRWASGIRQKQSRHASCIHEATALMLKIHQQSNMAVCAAGRSLAAS